jgi:hypothetical protein
LADEYSQASGAKSVEAATSVRYYFAPLREVG